MIREEQRTVYITEAGTETLDREAAVKLDMYEQTLAILQQPELDLYWREVGPHEIAKALHDAGYRIVKV